MALKANLNIDQGTDFSATIDLVDVNDNPYDLTGYSINGQIRKSYASTIAYDFTITHNGDLGKIFLTLSRTITGAMEPGRYLYDIEITSTTDKVTRVVEGIVTVTPGITR